MLSLGASCFVGVNLVEGVWRFTTPEPIGANRGPRQRHPSFHPCVSQVLTTIALAVALTSLWVHHRSPIPVAAGLCSLICFLICHIASLLYLRKLALRMSCRSEPSYALGLAMAVAGALVLTLLEGASLLGNRSSNLDYHAFIAVVCLSVMLVLAFAIIANRLYVMLDAAARSIPHETDRPGFAGGTCRQDTTDLGKFAIIGPLFAPPRPLDLLRPSIPAFTPATSRSCLPESACPAVSASSAPRHTSVAVLDAAAADRRRLGRPGCTCPPGNDWRRSGPVSLLNVYRLSLPTGPRRPPVQIAENEDEIGRDAVGATIDILTACTPECPSVGRGCPAAIPACGSARRARLS